MRGARSIMGVSACPLDGPRPVLDSQRLLDDLNDPQREAVTYGDGPLLIVAGAGSGKTRVITRRVAHLIGRGAHPSSILAITFTNKAAGEMRERVSEMIGDGRVWMSTFHSFCARVLRRDGEPVGLRAGFTIYDRDDQIALVKDICNEFSIDTQHTRPRALHGVISRFKNDGWSVDEAQAGAYSPFERTAARVYERYQETLEQANAADFDDLLLKTTRLFAENERVLQRYQDRFEHVLVDEYQDTNHTQYSLARDMAARTGNLCATGDPDQSIYGWRGARIENILDFERDFPGAHVVRLEQNYRSTQHILSAASGVIGNNSQRLRGDLWSELGDGEQVTVWATDDEEAEADAVARQIVALRGEGYPLSDMAILYRTNALSRGLERALRLNNLSYDIVGAVEFYQRKEVKDVLAYLRVLVNPDDAIAFLRIVNTPTRGIGKTTVDKLRAWAVPQGLSPRAAARRANEAPGLTARARKALATLTALLDELQGTLDGAVEDTFTEVLERTTYLDYLRDFGGQEATDRVENVRELEASVAAYARSHSEPTLGGFLEETALIADADTYRDDASNDQLVMMTLHAAKGLEFPVVFMVGMEEGLLPHQRALDGEDDGVQEERRLTYVGMTRAQRRLYLSYASRRPVRGVWMQTDPSRFLDELPPECVTIVDRRRDSGMSRRREAMTGWGGGRSVGGGRRPERAAEAEEVVYTPSADDYLDVVSHDGLPQPNQPVRHPHFGQGRVTAVQGTGPKARITVSFERFGEKQLIAEYARLEPMF